MSHLVETAITAETAAWWDVRGENVFHRTMTKEEVWEKGGINWPVELIPIEYNDEHSGWNLLVRGTDDRVLNCVTDHYTPLQNWDLLEYLELLVDSGDLAWESAMSLKGGKVVAVCARKPEGITIAGDEHVPYLTGANWHDGTRMAHIFFSGIRTVCWNTLNYGIDRAPNVFRFRHTGSMDEKLERARKELEVGFGYVSALKEMGEELALKPMSTVEFERFLDTAVPAPSEKERAKAKRVGSQDPMVAVLRTRDGLRAVCGDTPDLQDHTLGGRITAWGALQGTIAWNDHHRNFRSGDTRFEAAQLERTEMTQRAVEYLTAF